MCSKPELVEYRFSDPDRTSGEFEKLTCSITLDNKDVNTPIEALNACAANVGASNFARKMAQVLGMGARDLLVVLLEPTEIWSLQEPDTVFQHSFTLQQVDEELRYASKGQRNWRNTCIVDVRPYRSATIRAREDENQRHRNDELAYAWFEETFKEISPKVVLVCQCQTGGVNNRLARAICSNLHRVAEMRAKTSHELRFLVVNSFHPSTFRGDHLDAWFSDPSNKWRGEGAVSLRSKLLKAGFRLSFLTAMNALLGCKVSGFGTSNLQLSIKHNGPVLKFITVDGITRCHGSYEYTTTEDVCSQELWDRLKPLVRMSE